MKNERNMKRKKGPDYVNDGSSIKSVGTWNLSQPWAPRRLLQKLDWDLPTSLPSNSITFHVVLRGTGD